MVEKKLLSSIDTAFAIFSPSEKNVYAVCDYIFPTLKADDLRRTMIYYGQYKQTSDPSLIKHFDPVWALFSEYQSLQKTNVERVIRRMVRAWWKYIESLVLKPDVVIKYLSQKEPLVEEILTTPLGQDYTIYFTKRMKDFFYVFAWKMPRFHNNCGGLIRYGHTAQGYRFFCRKCNEIFSEKDIENRSYMQRKHQVNA